jgi:predicted TIM-barrel fold metal-dependent hydrolase
MTIDSHVHLFPPRVFAAIWRWFDRNAWKIAQKLQAEQILQNLADVGVDRVVGLAYSHVPEMARTLNHFMSELARVHPMLIPLGTVLPGEPDATSIVDEALRLGLRGFKIHCHVQRVAPDDARLDPIYARAAAAKVPIVIHAGRGPCLPGYAIHPAELCSVDATRRALERHPDLTLVVPHLGYDEEAAYFALLDQFSNLYLDTTMMLADYFPIRIDPSLLVKHSDRVLFGTDFPNIPYEYGRERAWIEKHISSPAREKILGTNALRLFG